MSPRQHILSSVLAALWLGSLTVIGFMAVPMLFAHLPTPSMAGTMAVAFLFGISGIPFGTGKAILAIIVAVFSSVAMSGIPGGGGVGELVLCSIFFNNSPDQLAVSYTLALAIGNLVDPPATMVNAAGDYVVSFIVSRYVDGKDWLQKQLTEKS